MDHPFFDATSYPWHRPDAIKLHRVLSEAVRDPTRIEMLYRSCGERLPDIAVTGVPPASIWTNVLNRLTTAGGLRRLCEQLQAARDLQSNSIQQAIRDVVDAQPEEDSGALPVRSMDGDGAPRTSQVTLQVQSLGHVTVVWQAHNGQNDTTSGEISDSEETWEVIEMYFSRLKTDRSEVSETDLKDLGQKMYDVLFPDQVGSLLKTAYDTVRLDADNELWLRLIIDIDPSSDVYTWPLEFLYCDDLGGWIATDHLVALSRRTIGRPSQPEPEQPPLRVLAVVSIPNESAGSDGELPDQVLVEMAKLGTRDQVKARTMETKVLGVISGGIDQPGIEYLGMPATYENLEELMNDREWRPQVVHFIENGLTQEPDEEMPEGAIGLVDEHGSVDWCSCQHISSVLNRDAGLHLVLLQGCRGAASGSEPAYTDFAERLARTDVAAVIGMQFSLDNNHATQFATVLYQELLKGKELDQAVQRGRKKIWYLERRSGSRFGAPVLYTARPTLIVKPGETGYSTRRPREQATLKALEGALAALDRSPYVAKIWIDILAEELEESRPQEARVAKDAGTMLSELKKPKKAKQVLGFLQKELVN